MDRKDVMYRTPSSPGIYLFKDSSAKIIYVGKAKDLRRRVASYFSRNHPDAKTAELALAIRDVDYIATSNEMEALLLESRLIKTHKPHYNIDLKFGERYAYIKVTDEPFPRIMTARTKEKDGTYFGPFTDGTAREEIVQLCRQLFRIRTCRRLPNRPCLLYHIKRCDAPCIGKITKKAYDDNIAAATLLLSGQTKQLLAQLEQDMMAASAGKRYEIARERRDQARAIKHLAAKQTVQLDKKHDQDIIAWAGRRPTAVAIIHIKRGVMASKEGFVLDVLEDDGMDAFVRRYYDEKTAPAEIVIAEAFDAGPLVAYLSREHTVRVTVPSRGEKLRLIEIARKNATLMLDAENPVLVELQGALKLPVVPRVIECFDISHMSGVENVGAIVQFVDGKPRKSAYRRFKMASDVVDDFASMHETVYRRYRRLMTEGGTLPDLVVIDGGRGQLSSAQGALAAAGADVPVVALAKEDEEIHIPGRRVPLRLDKKAGPLKLLMRIRDETHRFVIAYHRGRRSKRAVRSALDDVAGIGPRTKEKLYNSFGSLDRIKAASADEMRRALGAKTGTKVFTSLHQNS
ncbi:MAG: excinuclease ABC subunit UvrC [Nanoarchaeota archaeon]